MNVSDDQYLVSVVARLLLIDIVGIDTDVIYVEHVLVLDA